MKDAPTIPISKVLPRSGPGTLTAAEAQALLKIAFVAVVKETDQMTDAVLDAALEALGKELDKNGRQATLTKLAASCARPLVRDLAYKVAVAMSLADLEKSDEESDLDEELVQALKLTEEDANSLAQDVYAALETES